MAERTIPRFQNPSVYFLDVSKTLGPILDQEKEPKIGIDSLTTSITQRSWSHKGAWARIIKASLTFAGLSADILDEDQPWDAYDIIILEHGMEFDGVFNLFGGANDILANRIQRFLSYQGEILSFEVPMPDVGAFVNGRLSSCTEGFAALAPKVEELTAKSKSIAFFDTVDEGNKLIVGDSHSLSVWTPGSEIKRHDGKTLHGVLKQGIGTLVPEGAHYTDLTVYFGNIDVRHHVHRQADPMGTVAKLVDAYLSQLVELKNQRGLAIEVVSLLPIEDESRKLPKTGYYKGEPFAGSREQRQAYSDAFNDRLREMCPALGFSLWEWPDTFRDADGKLSFDVMEKPKSVHISPEWYRTDLDTREARTYVLVAETSTEVSESNTKEPKERKPRERKERTPKLPKFSVSVEPTRYFQDFLVYYGRALNLQRRNIGLEHEPVEDDLMLNVSIYDTVNRRYAGFSKVLEDLHYGPDKISYRQARTSKAYEFDHAQWQFIHLIHRITGSGASFEKDHGYRNTIVFDVADALLTGGFDAATDVVKLWDANGRAMFTSIGNQIPPFNKPRQPYTRGGIEYLCEYAPLIAQQYAAWLEVRAQKGLIGIREAVDWVLNYQSSLGLKRYAFVLTAWVMDTAEYMPYLVDSSSHCYYGKNCQEALDLFGDYTGKKALGYDAMMDLMCKETEDLAVDFHHARQASGHATPEDLPVLVNVPERSSATRYARPYDVEDVACDYIRYVENYVPNNKLGSYDHLDLTKVWNNSLIADHPKGRQKHLSVEVQASESFS